MKIRQVLLSLTGFALILGGLMYVDPRVSDRFSQLVSGGDGIASWDDRLTNLGGVLLSALKTQGLENGPVVVFAAVGAMLFLFMVRT